MRSTLYAVGAFLLLAYPLFLLIAIAGTLDQSQKNPDAAAIMHASPDQLLERESGPWRSGVVRNMTLQKSDD
mgnify:CR=1 FL=1